ncbi:putative ABC-type ATPase [Candidatus Nitrotoga sp. BS]|uniref:AAA family ATPase n=1 Tax=Candidatus Nitrotoga sp. BS TaxID=2890408 RepID=UPI001EF2B600|nr:AAA family ATPase [Candidatus Nitrotoga sp. BS]CAH1211057.1 putative ABC-type ATPase [Candidatus Nitrotoga sp. BS]
MKHKKQLWLLAGGNGSGKSTFYHTQLAARGIPFINADILAKELYPLAPELHSYDAALLATQMRFQLLREERSFCFETVFSHPSKIDFVAQAKTAGYEIILVFIHLNDVSLNQARIAQRMSEGGHYVPEEKVISRIPRVLKLIKQTLPLCNHTYILDNSRADNPFQQVAVIHDGQLELKSHSLPEWCQELLTDYMSPSSE